jgi:hypothetical protein
MSTIARLKVFFLWLNPSKIHKTIFDIRPDFIITTNWDDLLEQTVSENAFL